MSTTKVFLNPQVPTQPHRSLAELIVAQPKAFSLSSKMAKSIAAMLRSVAVSIEMINLVRQGIKAKEMADIDRLIGIDSFYERVGLKERTVRNWIQHDKHVPRDATESILAGLQVFDRAVTLFDGDIEAARRWLQTPAPALNGEKPADLLDTVTGANLVLEVVEALEHGIYL